MTKAKQDELTQRRRLNEGRCPVHGILMSQTGVTDEGQLIGCPRVDCNKEFEIQLGTKLWEVIHGEY